MPKLKPATMQKAAERGAEDVAAELDAQQVALANAQQEIIDAQRDRRAMLITASVDEVQAIDRRIGRAATMIDIAEARISALRAELESLQAADRDVEREANYERAAALAVEAEKLIRDAYRRHAIAIAAALGRLGEISREVGKLNEHLPPGVARIDIEEFRGFSRSLAEVVRLPSITCDEPDFWPLRQRFERVDVNQIYGSR